MNMKKKEAHMSSLNSFSFEHEKTITDKFDNFEEEHSTTLCW